MSINRNKEQIVVVSQDPKTVFSYGLQVSELIKGMPQYHFNVISNQYLYGRPFISSIADENGKIVSQYTTWAHEGEEARCTTTLKKVINHTDPVCVFSMGDIHHNSNIPLGKSLQTPWVSWFPWDNHDVPAMLRARHFIESPDVKVTMCDFSYNLLKNHGLEVDEMIYNIINTNVFKPLKSEQSRTVLEKLNPKIKDKKILLFVGRPSWRKNIEFLLGALKDILNVRKDVMLYLHVDFNDWGVLERPNIKKLIHALKLKDNILYTEENRWTTGIDSKFLNRLYNLIDLYVTPHGGEGFGLPICEAMACGKPFVATNCTSMPEFADGDKRGLLAKVATNKRERGVYRPWVDMDDFVEKVLYLLENDDVRKKMGKRGTYWVRRNCSHKKVIPKWEDVFKKLSVPLCRIDERVSILEWSDRYIPRTVDEK